MLVEICVSCFKSLNLAAKFGADRVELCQELTYGGLTPSMALVKQSVELGMNTQVLIRPRSGDFVYDEDEKTQMMQDIVHYQKLGIQGIVVGALTPQRELDVTFLRRLRMLTPNIELTFHKAFDDIENWQKAIEQLISMKFDRILTSGCEVNVFSGKERLKEIIEFASGRIQVLPGGGISPENIDEFIKFLKPNELHFSGAKKKRRQNSKYFISEVLLVDEKKLKMLIDSSRR
tara:strand:+ start:3894 stop:4592 length:699 start_codon:yes stop_codon:yes gene_type:complete